MPGVSTTTVGSLTPPGATLRFEGRRFEGHALDVENTRELLSYRALVLACAKELWRRKHPDRARLPNGFDEGFRVDFDRVDEGSASVPLRRVLERAQSAPSSSTSGRSRQQRPHFW